MAAFYTTSRAFFTLVCYPGTKSGFVSLFPLIAPRFTSTFSFLYSSVHHYERAGRKATTAFISFVSKMYWYVAAREWKHFGTPCTKRFSLSISRIWWFMCAITCIINPFTLYTHCLSAPSSYSDSVSAVNSLISTEYVFPVCMIPTMTPFTRLQNRFFTPLLLGLHPTWNTSICSSVNRAQLPLTTSSSILSFRGLFLMTSSCAIFNL